MALVDSLTRISQSLKQDSWSAAQCLVLLESLLGVLSRVMLAPTHKRLFLSVISYLRPLLNDESKSKAVELFRNRRQGDVMMQLKVYEALGLPVCVQVLAGLVQAAALNGTWDETQVPKFQVEAGQEPELQYYAGTVFLSSLSPSPPLLQHFIDSHLTDKTQINPHFLPLYKPMLAQIDAAVFKNTLFPVIQRLIRRSANKLLDIAQTFALLQLDFSECAKELVFPSLLEHLFKPETAENALEVYKIVLEKSTDHSELATAFLQIRDQNEFQAVILLRCLKRLRKSGGYSEAMLEYCLDRSHRLKTEENKAVLLDCVEHFADSISQKVKKYFEKEGPKATFVNVYVKLGGNTHICALSGLTAMQMAFVLSISIPSPCPAGLKAYFHDSFSTLSPSSPAEVLCVTRAALKAFELFPENAILVKKIAKGLLSDSISRDFVMKFWPNGVSIASICGFLVEFFSDLQCWDQFRQNYKRITRHLFEKSASESDKVAVIRLYSSSQVTTEENMKRLRYLVGTYREVLRSLPEKYLFESAEMASLMCVSGFYGKFIERGKELMRREVFLQVEALETDFENALKDPEFMELQRIADLAVGICRERGLEVTGTSEVPQIQGLLRHLTTKSTESARYVLQVHTLCAHMGSWKSIDTASVQYDLLSKVLLQALALCQVPSLQGDVYTCVTEVLKHIRLFHPIYYDMVKVLLSLQHSQWKEKPMKRIITYITDKVTLDTISPGEAFVFNYLLSATVYQNVTNLRTSATNLLERLVYEKKFESLGSVVQLAIHLLETYSSQAVSQLLTTLTSILAPSDWKPLLEASVTMQPASKLILLNNLLQYEEGLPYVEWVEAPVWLMMNDDSEDVNELALDVWHKFKLQLSPTTVLHALPQYLYHDNEEVQTIAAQGIASVWGLYPWHVRDMLDRVLAEFRLRRKHKEGLPLLLNRVTPVLADYALELLTFIIQEGVLEHSQHLRDRMIQLGIHILHYHGLQLVNTLFQVLQTAIEGSDDHSKFAAVLLLGNLAEHFPSDDVKVNHTIDLLLKSLESTHEAISPPVAECLPRLIAKRREQGQQFLENYMKVIFSPTAISKKRGSAYGLAAILKGLGIDSFVKFGVLERFDDIINNKKASVVERGSVLMALEGLSAVLKSTLEPYLPELVPFVLDCYADSQLMTQAQSTIKTMVSGLSARGVRSVLPLLTFSLEDSKWKTKIGAIEALGKIAFCAPHQLSTSLPDVVPQVIKAFSDTHPEVFQAATRALADIGSVIANPEVSDIVPILIKALGDASTQKEALSTLLETGFMHFIDPPSLSILIPIVESGLKSRQPEIKKMASQVIGGILALVPTAKSITPYITRLITALKSALFDSIPEVRNVAAQNLGSLCRFIGAKQSKPIIEWLESIFFAETSTQVERSGAVHAYSEVLIRLSPTYWEQALPRILELCRHPDYFTRVCFLGVLIFLPEYTAGRFEEHLYEMLPAIFDNLSHENDEVRSVAVRIMQIIIKGYSRKYLDKLLPPLEAGLFSSNYKTRQSSIILVGEMMELIESMDRREGKKEGTIPYDQKNRLLSAIYILRSDHTGTIHTQAAKIWKDLVENTPRVIPTLTSYVVERLLEIAESPHTETLNIVTAAIQNILEKYEEKLFQDYLNQFAQHYHSHPRGVAIAMKEVCDCATKKMFATYPEPVVRIVHNLLLSADPVLLSSAGDIFSIIYEKVGAEGCKDFLNLLLQSVEGNPKAYRELLKSRNQSITKSILPVIMKHPTTRAQILTEIADLIANDLFSILEFKGYFQTMVKGMKDSEEMVQAVMRVMASVSDYAAIGTGWEVLSSVESGKEVVMVIREFANSTTLDFLTFVPRLFTMILPCLPTKDPETISLISPTLSSLLKPIQKEELYTLLPYLQSELEKSPDTLDLFSLPKALDPFISIVSNSLLSGPQEYKELAAQGYCQLVRLTSPKPLESYVITLAGPLIRVLSERVPHPVRVFILDALQLLLQKGAAKLKTFTPQLRTIFIKSLQHSEETVRVAGMRNLLELLPLETRIDLVINELCTLKNDEEVVISALTAVTKISEVVTLTPQIRTSATNKLIGDLDTDQPLSVLRLLSTVLIRFTDHPPSVIQSLSKATPAAIVTLGCFLSDLNPEYMASAEEIYRKSIQTCYEPSITSLSLVVKSHPVEGFSLLSQSFPVIGRKLTPAVYQLLTEIPYEMYRENKEKIAGLMPGLAESAAYNHQLGRRSRDLDNLLTHMFALESEAGRADFEACLEWVGGEERTALRLYAEEIGRSS